MKKYLILIAAMLTLFVSCKKTDVTGDSSTTETSAESIINNEDDYVEYSDFSTTVQIVYDGSSATVTNPADGAGVTVTTDGGQVTVTSTIKGVEYAVSGSGSGQLKIYSDYKFKMSLSSLTLKNTSGPAINIQSGKRNFAVISGTNTITGRGNDTGDDEEDEKGAFFSEGQVIVSGDGSLNISSSYKHGFASDDYIRIRSGAVTITAEGTDGIHTNEGFIMDGGSLTITSVDDGICAGDDDNAGYTYIQGGSISITTSGSSAKGIKAYGDMVISGGDIDVTTPGSGSEGIESKSTIVISDGNITINANDDALNSGGDMYLKGGNLYARSTGNDGIDANGNCYIQGGVIYAIGASSPEVAIDANTEGGAQLYLTGGTLIAISDLERGASLSQSCYKASSYSANTWYALYNGGSLVLAFKTPSNGGSSVIVSTSSTPTLTSGVDVSGGTSYFGGMANIGCSVSGGSSVSLSAYSSSSSSSEPGGGGQPSGKPGR